MRAQRSKKKMASVEATTVLDARTTTALEPPARTRWRRLLSVLLWVMTALLVLTLALAGAVYGGLYQGEREKQQRHQAVAEQYYRDGLQKLDAGQYELAIADFEYVLDLDPGNTLAQQRIAEAQARIAARPTPPTPTVEVYEIVADDLYQQALAHYQAQEWAEAAAVLTQVRGLDATYKAEDVEEMLFTSLYNAGMALLNEDRFEEGIFYLDQAVALRPLDEQALNQRSLAIQYLTALGYWGVDWEECIRYFEQLYAIAPSYQDVFRRLYSAHVAYGDAWYNQGEMCPAQEQYALALQLMNDPTIERKRAEAEQVCLVATPTPIAPIEGTQTITLTQLPPGFTGGRLAYPAYDTQTGLYDVYVLFPDARLVKVASGADQPFWLRNSGALAYRNLLSPGISLLWPGGTGPQQVISGSGLAWPTSSPDGSRMAYAAQDAAGTWQINIAPTDGSSAPTVYASGTGPVWGPTGWLAWTGCDASGGCGILLGNPDSGQPAVRQSASINDIGLNWSPDGGNLLYMSNVSGNWDVFLYSISGGFLSLTNDPNSDGLPVWAPDGSGIAFVSNRDGGWGVYLMGPNGENQHKILDLGPNLPDWTMQRLSWAP